MRRASLIMVLLVLLTSLFLLSVLSNILTGYPESVQLPDTPRNREETDAEEEPLVLLFKVSPVTPQLYWRTTSADYYSGLNWLRTTSETVVEDFPRIKDANATRIFTVELNSTQREVFLPVASANSNLENLSVESIEGLELFADVVGNVFSVIKHEPASQLPLVYNVSWNDVEIDDRLISLDDIPEEFLDKYLQLPNIPYEIWQLAEDLKDPSYSVLDQILADVQFLRTNFTYETEKSKRLFERISQGSDLSSFMRRRKGVCIDAATALAVILRYQKIPARISIGYKPERVEGGKVLYYTTGAHSVTEVYLPPYGWVQFDATPPLERNPLVRVMPFKKEASPESRLFYQLSITNRRNVTDNFKLSVYNRLKWNMEAAPREIRVDPFQTADALLEVTISEDANLGEKNQAILTVASSNNREVAFSVMVIIQVANVTHIPTTTTLEEIDEEAIRGSTFSINGTISASNDEPVDNMTIFVYLAKNRETDGVVVGKGYSMQGDFQIESAVPYSMEIGDYKVILISLGTTQHAPSSSNSTTRIRATTRIELGSEDEFLIGYGAIHGRLTWDNGTGFASGPISLEITSSATSPEVWEMQNLTSKDGTFRIETRFRNVEEYEVEAMFSGDAYVLGSSTTRVIKLKSGRPTIQVSSESTAIRGRVFNVTGAVQFEDIGVWGEIVTITFDNELLSTVETGENGSYAYSFLVDSTERLGPHIVNV
ncbi:MAG: transglutaminase-like domain-containing protein, partial [Candidatus Bathyarchaeota archaeon]